MRDPRASVPSDALRHVSALGIAQAVVTLGLAVGLAGFAVADSLKPSQVIAPDVGGPSATTTESTAMAKGANVPVEVTVPAADVPGTSGTVPVLVLSSFTTVGDGGGGTQRSQGSYRLLCTACGEGSQPIRASINWTNSQSNSGGLAWIFNQPVNTAATYQLRHQITLQTGGGTFNTGSGTVVAVPLKTSSGVVLGSGDTRQDSFGGASPFSPTVVADSYTGITSYTGTQWNPVTSVTSSGTTATVSMSGHTFQDNDRVLIKGAANSDYYNGYFTISNVVAGVSFQYTMLTSPVPSPATGTIYAGRVARAATSVTLSGSTATVTLSSHGFSVGDKVAIQGATNYEGYNGDYYVTGVTTNTFTYSTFSGGTSPATGTIHVRRSALKILTMTQISPTSTVVVTTQDPHGLAVGDRIAIAGLADGVTSENYLKYQGIFEVNQVDSTTVFRYNASSGGLTAIDPASQPVVRRVPTDLDEGVFLRKSDTASFLETSVTVTSDPHVRRDVFLAFVASQGQVNASNVAQWRYGLYQLYVQSPTDALTNTWRPVVMAAQEPPFFQPTTPWEPVRQTYLKTADGVISGSVPDDQNLVMFKRFTAREGGLHRFRVMTAMGHGGSGVRVLSGTLIALNMSWSGGYFAVLQGTQRNLFSSSGNEQWLDFDTLTYKRMETQSFSRTVAGSSFVAAGSANIWPTKGGGDATLHFGVGMRDADWTGAQAGTQAWGIKKNAAGGVQETSRNYNGSVGRACVLTAPLLGCEAGSQASVGVAASPTYPISSTGVMPPWQASTWGYMNGVDLAINADIVVFETESNAPTWAAVDSLRASTAGGKAIVSWNTSAEVGTAAFRLERYDTERKHWVTVGPATIPALPPWPAGATYQVDDAGAVAGATYEYRLVEEETKGASTTYGPFKVTVEGDSKGSAYPAVAGGPGYYRIPNPPTGPKTVRPSMAGADLPWARSSWKAWVDEEGIYAFPLSATGDPEVSRNHRMTNLGREVAFANDGPGQRLLFYGKPLRNLHTYRNAYLLKPGAPTFMREVMGKAPAPAAQPRSFSYSRRFEEDTWPALGWVFDASHDFWMWKTFMAETPGYQTAEIPLDLPLVDTGGGPVTLTFGIYGISDSAAAADYHLRAWVNGAPAGDVTLGGAGPLSGSVTVDASLLVTGTNVLRLDAVLDPGLARSWWYLNAVDVTYPRLYEAYDNEARVRVRPAQAVVTVDGFTSPDVVVFDVTDPAKPVWIKAVTVQEVGKAKKLAVSFAPKGGREFYLAAANRVRTAPVIPMVDAGLAAGTGGAEHVVVAPYDLIGPAKSLAEYRTAQGLSSAVVPLEAVWDELGEGLPSPDALQAFVDLATRRWSLAAKYVAFAGRGTYDERDVFGYGDCLVPTRLVATSRGLVGNDSGYVEGTDAVIGRIPVTTAAGLQAYLDKLVLHEKSPRSTNVTLAADNADGGGDFAFSSDMLGTEVPRTYWLRKAYLGPMSVAGVRDQLLAALGRGDAVVNWVGHGGSTRLASEGVLTLTDLPAIPASQRLSLVTGATCIVNQFHSAGSPSIGERLAALPGGGAVATWAPTGVAYNDMSVALVRSFLTHSLGEKAGPVRIGDAVRAVRSSLPVEADGTESLSLFEILGDPACYAP